MEIILLENILNLGNIGDKVKVKNGFGRNFLLKQGKALRFNKESKENGALYGSIKPKEITNLIKEKVNAEVAPSQIILKDELNKIGSFNVEINFHSEVKANVSIKIDKIQSK
jgi:large subunit ribosomal protein L9